MKKILLLLFIVPALIVSGCTTDDGAGDWAGNGGVLTCPIPSEVDALELSYNQTRFETWEFLENEYEYGFTETFQSANLAKLSDGRQNRLEYEAERDYYQNVGLNMCERSDGSTLEGGSAPYLRCADLIRREIQPENFMDMPVVYKSRYLYEEPTYWTG